MNLKYLLLSFLLILNLSVLGQISSPADFSEATEYSDDDFVFVFCSDEANAGELIADDSTGSGAYDFVWYRFNETTNDFSDVLAGFTINTDSTQSIITSLTTGGYKVVLTNGGFVQEYVAWVYINTDFHVEIQFSEFNDCDYVWMQTEPYIQRGQEFATTLTYYDTNSDQAYILKNSVEYEWSATPDEDDFRKNNAPFASIVEDPFDNESELPTENTIFSVIVTNRFGCQTSGEIEYTAIETNADLSWTIIDDKTGDELESGNSDATIVGSAPLMLRFKNESLNAQSYEWFFGDTLWNNDIDTLKTDDFLYEPEHTYYYTVPDSGKTYTLRLYSESEYGCRDSIFVNIKVDPSKIEFPNVFTPNHDDFNNVFIMKDDFKSIRSFKITIFNRVGQVVHEFEGDIRDWEGWKGKVRGSDRDAPEGNYFFVVEVTGWDNVNYNNKNLGNESSSQSSEGGVDQSSNGGKSFGVVRLFREY